MQSKRMRAKGKQRRSQRKAHQREKYLPLNQRPHRKKEVPDGDVSTVDNSGLDAAPGSGV